MEQKKDCNNQQPCPCHSAGCAHHGKCCECVAYHRDRGNLPICLRDAK